MTQRQLIKDVCVITVDPVIGTMERGDILIDVRMDGPIADIPMDPLPD